MGEALTEQTLNVDKVRYDAKQTFRNKIVFTELDTLTVVARDAIGKMIRTSAQFAGVDRPMRHN